jgi:hypothetical protein
VFLSLSFQEIIFLAVMKSRTKKWAHYRESIKKLPAEKFPKRQDYSNVASLSDLAEMNVSAKAANALSGNDSRNSKATPYAVYQRRRRNMLIFKLATTAVVLAGFICAWFLWVMR